MKKYRLVFIIVIVFLAVLCSAFLLTRNNFASENVKAVIYVNGYEYMSVYLSEENLYKEYTIETEYGVNTLFVSDEGICVIDSNCPDKTCINTGFTNNPIKPVICMPNRLEIVIEGSDYDGVAR